jgi:hypothetical protein
MPRLTPIIAVRHRQDVGALAPDAQAIVSWLRRITCQAHGFATTA